MGSFGATCRYFTHLSHRLEPQPQSEGQECGPDFVLGGFCVVDSSWGVIGPNAFWFWRAKQK